MVSLRAFVFIKMGVEGGCGGRIVTSRGRGGTEKLYSPDCREILGGNYSSHIHILAMSNQPKRLYFKKLQQASEGGRLRDPISIHLTVSKRTITQQNLFV